MVSLKLHKNGKWNANNEYKPVYSQIYSFHGGRVLSQYYSRKHAGTVWQCFQPSTTDGRSFKTKVRQNIIKYTPVVTPNILHV